MENSTMILYHGSKNKFNQFSLEYCNPFKDFGTGIYFTKSITQAEQWAKQKANSYGIPYLYSIKIPDDLLLNNNYSILKLTSYNEEWANYICKCRMEGYNSTHDLVYDRIADNKYKQLTKALEQYYQKLCTLQDLLQTIKNNNINADQYCFKSEKIVNYINTLSIECTQIKS